MIPQLQPNGLLPAGIHKTTLSEIKAHFFGSGNRHRKQLLAKAIPGIERLFKAGIQTIWLDGSFTTSKLRPGDIDGVWLLGPRGSVDLKSIEDDFADPSVARAKYGLDFYPNVIEGSSGKPFVDFFQETIDGEPKGILVLEQHDFNT